MTSRPSPIRSHRAAPPLVLMAGVLAVVALVGTACTGDDDRSLGEATGRTQSQDALDPTTAPPLPPQAGGEGPAVPVLTGVVVDQTLGSTTSVQPTLRWTDAAGPAPFRFTVRDLGPDGGQELWSSGDQPQPVAAVPEGVLANRRAYRWSVTDGAGTTLGPMVLSVDVQREGIQDLAPVGDVAVATASGEAVVTWSSPQLSTVDGEVGFGLSHRPSNGQDTVGLPAGWRLSASGSGGWRRLVANEDDTVTAEAESGLLVVFEPEPGGGGYRAAWGERQRWPSGRFSTLTRNEGDDSFTLQDTSGTVTTFAAPDGWTEAPVESVWTAGTASPTRTYDRGRLVAVTDPVSDRRVEFRYGGQDCPSPGPDFDAAPDGLLCGAVLWDGSKVAVGYDGAGDDARLTRLVGFVGARSGTEVTDLAYDGAGRVVAVRSPQGARVVAAGVRTADDTVTTQVGYDATGRAVRVTMPAPSAGQARAVRGFDYALADDRLTTTVTAPDAPGSPVVSTAVVDAATFQVAESRDAAGRVTLTTWDRGSDRVTETVVPGGLITRYVPDELGVPTERIGPATAEAIASGAAPRQSVEVDRTFRGADDLDGEAMEGLAVTYWEGDAWLGDPAGAEVGPEIDGDVPDEYRFSWPDPPVGGDGWSARLTGVLRLPGGGPWSISTGGAALWVDERPCRPTCAVTADGPEAVRIRLDVVGPTGDVELTWSGPGAEGVVPTAALAPALGRQAVMSVADATATGDPVEFVGRTEWSDPVAGVIGSSLSPSGIRRSTRVEPYRPAEGRFARVTGQVAPSGSTRTLEYHPTREAVANPCPAGGAAVQGGLVRSNVDPAGDGVPAVTSETVYDAAGRPLATRSTTEEAWTCTTRDAAGRAVLTENLGAEGDEERTVEIDHAAPSAVAADDPLVTSVRSTTASGDTATETQTVDLLGRPVRVVDLWGTVVEQTYDPQFPERVVTSTVRPVGSAPVTTTYDYDQSGNRLRAVSGGLVLSAYTYDANGWVSSITNGPNVTTYDYDANGRPVVRTVDGPSGRWSEVQTLSPAGRTLAAVLDGPGDQDGAYDFTYDVDGQLVAARLDTPLAVAERAWTYAYDPDGNLTTRSTTDGAGATSTITNAYDGASHLVATDDPRFADPVDAARSGRVATDDHGRITEIGPLGIDYDADGNATGIGHADGSSVAWTYRFGRSVQRTVAAPAGSAAAPQVVRIGVGGVMYDGTGRYLGRGTGGSGSDLWQRADGSQRWTFSTIGGNEWFSTDAAGVATGPVALYEPFGRQVHPLPTPPSAPTGATTTTGPTTTAPTTTAPAPTTPTTTAPPTTTAAPTTTDGPAPTTAASTTVAPDGADPAASGRVATQGPAPTAPATPDPAADPLDPGFQMADRTTLGVLDVLPMGSRTYLPALGRFLQPDPIPGGSGNPYAYTDGDPVNSHDVSGNMPEWLRTTLGVVAGVAGVALAAVAGPRAGTYVASRVAAGASMARTRAVEHTVSFVVGAASGAAGAAGGQAIALGEVDAVPTVIVGLASGAIGALMSAYRAAQVDEMLQGYIDATKASRARNFEKVVQWKAKSFKNFKVSEIKRGMNGDVAFVGQPINVGQGGQVLGGGSSINVGPQPKSFTVIPGGKARGRSPSFGDKADVSADY